MNSLDIPSHVLQRFRTERLAHHPVDTAAVFSLSPSRLWDTYFQCTIQPDLQKIDPEIRTYLANLYHVSTSSELLPRYFENAGRWGAIVSPRAMNRTHQRVAQIEHWYVTDPFEMSEMLDMIKDRWPLPYDLIRLPICPNHPGVGVVSTLPTARLEECAFMANWAQSPPPTVLPDGAERWFTSSEAQFDRWWPDFQRLVERGQIDEDMDPGMLKTQLQKELERCQKTGGIVNVFDGQELMGFILWERRTDLELLVLQGWHINNIFVRPDVRGKGVGKFLCTLAAQRLNLTVLPLMCTRVQGENLASQKVLEAIGAHRVLDFYVLSQSVKP